MRILSKVSLSFWIALSVALTAVIINLSMAVWASIQPPSPRMVSLNVLQDCAESAVATYQQGGPGALSHYFMQPHNGCPDAILVDVATTPPKNVLDKTLARRTMSLAEEVRNSGKATFELLPWRTLIAIPASSSKSASYVYIATVWAVGGSLPYRVALQFATIVLVSGILCYVLTLYFGRPLVRLGRLAENLGAGNLGARIDQSLTRRKDEVGDLAHSFNRMAAKIETLVADYKSFLAHVSHELGSPLTRVNMALGLARRKAPTSLEPELDRIGDETERLSTLVQELLLLARLESGNELDRQTSSFNAGLVVEEACADVNFEAGLVGKSVVFQRREDFTVNGHRELLRRSLDNVLRNGLRFSREGGSVQVDVFYHPQKGMGIIAIRDDGPGIHPDQQNLIFEPFVTLPNRVTGLIEGSGLGLAISRHAVIANGGRIYAHNSEQGGLTVTIELPVEDLGQSLPLVRSGMSNTPAI